MWLHELLLDQCMSAQGPSSMSAYMNQITSMYAREMMRYGQPIVPIPYQQHQILALTRMVLRRIMLGRHRTILHNHALQIGRSINQHI